VSELGWGLFSWLLGGGGGRGWGCFLCFWGGFGGWGFVGLLVDEMEKNRESSERVKARRPLGRAEGLKALSTGPVAPTLKYKREGAGQAKLLKTPPKNNPTPHKKLVATASSIVRV